jgi:hypothetical protein
MGAQRDVSISSPYFPLLPQRENADKWQRKNHKRRKPICDKQDGDHTKRTNHTNQNSSSNNKNDPWLSTCKNWRSKPKRSAQQARGTTAKKKKKMKSPTDTSLAIKRWSCHTP